MKLALLFHIVLSLVLSCCQQPRKGLSQVPDTMQSIIIDSSLRDTVKRNIKFVSDTYFSEFKTPIEARFYSNGLVSDSIIQDNFSMISWYSSHKDTIDIVAHVGEFETEALLIRITDAKPMILFFRAPHDTEGSKYFKINKEDSFSHVVKIKPVSYELKLSEIPDTTNKQVVFGHITMKSGGYYDRRDSVEQKHEVYMKFYFRSQFRKFDY